VFAWRQRLGAGLSKLVDAELVINGELSPVNADQAKDLGAVSSGFENGGLDLQG
jgi:hypothetical protein